MTKAPDRIWAVHRETLGAVMIGEWADTIRHLGGTEYVRADLAHVNEPQKPEQDAADVAAERGGRTNATTAKSNATTSPPEFDDLVVLIIRAAEQSCQSWEYAYAYNIADALLAAGWRRVEQGEKP